MVEIEKTKKIELKTLKDIESVLTDDIVAMDRVTIQQEAIEWVKAFNKGELHTDFCADGRKGQENVCEWIQHFFNIREEDTGEPLTLQD